MILPLLWPAALVQAQEPETPEAIPEQWQLSLDVIKSRARDLMLQNNSLQVKYAQMEDDSKQLQKSITRLEEKNEAMDRLLKDRHGRTDQQIRIEELKQEIEFKRHRLSDLGRQSAGLKKERLGAQRDSVRRDEAAQDQREAAETHAGTGEPDDLGHWRNRLEEENRREVILENELRDLKSDGQTQESQLKAVNEENRRMEAAFESLQAQKTRISQQHSPVFHTPANARRYDQLKKRKEELEAKINAYEMRLEQLGVAAVSPVSWPQQKKQMVHQMVLNDARNNKIRNQIKELREDIVVLRDQVARLERRLDFAQSPGNK